MPNPVHARSKAHSRQPVPGPLESSAQLAKVQDIALPSITSFPNLAGESVRFGLAKEAWMTEQVNHHLQKTRELQEGIDLLLDLSAELATMPSDSEMSDRTKNILAQLKERGIDLWKGEGTFLSKEQISELKSLSSARVDKMRSDLQILLATQIQVALQCMSSVWECVKGIIQSNAQLLRATVRLPGH